jgi:16S rRNA (cytosine967-C5)-methyltransferase
MAALATLRRLADRRTDLASALEQVRGSLRDERDRALTGEIVLGTLRWRSALDHAIAWAGNRDVSAFDDQVLDILRLSTYQLLHLDRVPASAVVDDAVNLCKQAGNRAASGAVNAILRRISRSRREMPRIPESDQLDVLSVEWSHPRWLGTRWLERLGFDRSLAWMRFNNAPAPVTLRANALRGSREALADALRAEDVETQPCRWAPDGLVVVSGHPQATPQARAGLFDIQDEASQLVGAFVAPPPGACVIDACAAPGGKSIQLAAALGGSGFLVACDSRPRRIRVLRTALRAAGLDAVPVVQHDLLKGLPFGPTADCVLVDAPCSGLGTLRRDPDIKWRIEELDLVPYAARQLTMLAAAAAGVRPGGLLVYSTCSTEPEENEGVVDTFLATNPAFTLEDPRTAAGRGEPPGVRADCLDSRGCLRTCPDLHGLEGFFAARLRRRS